MGFRPRCLNVFKQEGKKLKVRKQKKEISLKKINLQNSGSKDFYSNNLNTLKTINLTHPCC